MVEARGGTYAPATKWAHDLADGGEVFVTEAPVVVCGGMTSPVSRDCVRVVDSMSEEGVERVCREVWVYWEVMHGVV